MKIAKALALTLAAASLVSCGANLLPSHDSWYAQHYFIMQDDERKAYRDMSEAGRLELQKIFWASRPAPAKMEFDKRMEHITSTYRKENSSQPWNTDRARVYLLNGSPASIDFADNDSWTQKMGVSPTGQASLPTVASDRAGEDIQASSYEVWSYPFGRYIIVYGFAFQPPNKWKAAQMAAGAARWIGQLETKNRVELWGPSDPEAYKARLEELKAIK